MRSQRAGEASRALGDAQPFDMAWVGEQRGEPSSRCRCRCSNCSSSWSSVAAAPQSRLFSRTCLPAGRCSARVAARRTRRAFGFAGWCGETSRPPRRRRSSATTTNSSSSSPRPCRLRTTRAPQLVTVVGVPGMRQEPGSSGSTFATIDAGRPAGQMAGREARCRTGGGDGGCKQRKGRSVVAYSVSGISSRARGRDQPLGGKSNGGDSLLSLSSSWQGLHAVTQRGRRAERTSHHGLDLRRQQEERRASETTVSVRRKGPRLGKHLACPQSRSRP